MLCSQSRYIYNFIFIYVILLFFLLYTLDCNIYEDDKVKIFSLQINSYFILNLLIILNSNIYQLINHTNCNHIYYLYQDGLETNDDAALNIPLILVTLDTFH